MNQYWLRRKLKWPESNIQLYNKKKDPNKGPFFYLEEFKKSSIEVPITADNGVSMFKLASIHFLA